MSDSSASAKRIGSTPVQIAASLLDHVTLDEALALLGAVNRILHGDYSRPIEIQQPGVSNEAASIAFSKYLHSGSDGGRVLSEERIKEIYTTRGYDAFGNPYPPNPQVNTATAVNAEDSDDEDEVEPDHIDRLLSDIRSGSLDPDGEEPSHRKSNEGVRGFMGPAATLRERYGPTYHDAYYWRSVITDQYIPHLREIGRKSFNTQDFYDWVHQRQTSLLSESDKAMLSSSVRWRSICANIFSNVRRSEGTARALGLRWTGYFFRLAADDEKV